MTLTEFLTARLVEDSVAATMRMWHTEEVQNDIPEYGAGLLQVA